LFKLRFVDYDWQELADAAELRLVRPRPAEETVVDTERALGSSLSRSLRDLYAHCDGLIDEWGYEYVLPIIELGQRNREFRTELGELYLSFNDLTLFGQMGNGDMLFQPAVPKGNENVFLWDHEDDSRTWYATDVAAAVRRLAAD
jgi:hypothetical protein